MDRSFKAAIYLAFLVLLTLLIYLILLDKPGQFMTLCACVLVLVGARVRDLVRLKLGRDGLEADLERIRNSLDELQNIAELFGQIALRQMQGSGRWGGYSKAEKDGIRGDIVSGLRKIELPEQRIRSVLAVEQPFFHFDYFQRVTSQVDEVVPVEQQGAWTAFMSTHRDGFGTEASPAELEAALNDLGLLSGDILEAWSDYRQFHHHQTHRRPDRFGYLPN